MNMKAQAACLVRFDFGFGFVVTLVDFAGLLFVNLS